jgi:GNAT superfamily N-acetyltransferase
MLIENLNANHVEQAAGLALSEYYEERGAVPVLPDGDYLGRLCDMVSKLADNNLGIAAVEGGETVGFLTCLEPWTQHFGTTMGIFSPIHAHAAKKEGRGRIYPLLYQAAAEKWVKQGILSHAIALYAHDAEAVGSFFRNGFGLRCVDAIRPVRPIACGEFPGCTFCELPKEEIMRIVPLKNGLLAHLRDTPMFIPLFFSFDLEKVTGENEKRDSRYFVVRKGDITIAFIEVTAEGENFASDDPSMANICGAYMLPEYRGSGIFTKLFAYLLDILADEGYSRCGVDFESFNPTASGFWLKHFTAYTYSVARRIDERIYKPVGL